MNYKTPGVYIEEISAHQSSVEGVETAIPAFIGYTEKAEENGNEKALQFVPTRITSLLEFSEKFGGPQKEEFEFTIVDTYGGDAELTSRDYRVRLKDDTSSPFRLFYSLQFYFSNGGGPCYIVSVGDYSDAIEAGDAEKKEGLMGGIQVLDKSDEPTLIVFPDAMSLQSANDYGEVVKTALTLCNKLKDRFTIIDRYNGDTGLSDFRKVLGNSFLSYGAAYYPNLKTTFNFQMDREKSSVRHLVQGTAPNDVLNLGENIAFDSLESDHPGICRSLEAEVKKINVELPPSGAIAGIYAQVDRKRGVWKAPANVRMNSVIKPTVNITNEMQEELNVDPVTGKSINAIRFFKGKGTLVWGARTLAGNDNEWRYVPTKRLFIFVEESIKKATEFVVFEPNTANTWVHVKTMINNFLTGIWRDGALAGATTKEAFFVKVGLGETMTEQDMLEGRLIIEIGLAAVRPAEFIILRILHQVRES